jgi:glycolate oxidase
MSGLKEIVGEGNVLESKIDLVVYGSDASLAEGKARAIVFPTDAEQVQKLVRYAKRTDANIVVRGGGSGLSGGAVPQDSIVLDLSKMNKVVEIGQKEKYAIVQPGVVLDELNGRLAPELCFPVRPSSHSVATIGGMIATNAAGNNAIKYGWTIDWVSQLLVVDGTGKMFDVKGDDIKMFCGREGTTGIIVEARLRLSERLETKSMEHLKFNDIDEMIKAVKIYKDKKSVSTIEFFNRFCAEFAGVDKLNHLMVGFESEEGSIKGKEEIERLWKMREGIGPVCSGMGFSVMEDPRVNEDSLGEFLKWFEKKELPCFGHIGVGIFHPRFKKGSETMIKEMFELVRKLGGKVSGEHGIGLTKRGYAEKEQTDEVRKLKHEFDPDNILNKGKVI